MYNLISYILIQQVCQLISQSIEVLKPRSFLIKLSPELEGPKTIQDFYFYVRFCAATAVVDGGGIFGIWRVGEEIWVRFFGLRV